MLVLEEEKAFYAAFEVEAQGEGGGAASGKVGRDCKYVCVMTCDMDVTCDMCDMTGCDRQNKSTLYLKLKQNTKTKSSQNPKKKFKKPTHRVFAWKSSQNCHIHGHSVAFIQTGPKGPGRLVTLQTIKSVTIPHKNFAIHSPDSRAGCAAAPASQGAVSSSLCGNVDSKWWRCCRARSERVRLKREAE